MVLETARAAKIAGFMELAIETVFVLVREERDSPVFPLTRRRKG